MSRGITAEVPSAAAPHRERREREKVHPGEYR